MKKSDSKLAAIGSYLAVEFKAATKAYFSPVVGLLKGRPISYTMEAYKELEDKSNQAWKRVSRAFGNH